MKKIFIGLIIVILIFATAIVILVNSWSDTGYGKLDYKAAIALKIIELNKDSRSPYEIPADEQRRYFYDSSKQFKGDIPEVAGIKDIKIHFNMCPKLLLECENCNYYFKRKKLIDHKCI